MEIVQRAPGATLGSARPPSLYGGGAPPLAAEATVVERSYLHLHKGDGELVAFPVVPVDTLPERESHFRDERFAGDVSQNGGRCGTSVEKQVTFSTKCPESSDADSVTEGPCKEITPAVSSC